MTRYIDDDIEWTDRGMLFKPARNADEAELEAMRFGSTPLDTGVQDDVIAEEHHADYGENLSHWEEEDIALEQAVGPVIAEIDRRSILGGESYPFKREHNTLKYSPSITKVYESCLAISLQKDVSSGRFKIMPLAFELICAEVARLYLGPGALSVRTGWPPHGERPSDFRELITLLAAKTGEFRWSPRRHYEPGEKVKGVKDEGWDYVAWKPFPDKRIGQLFLLGQCACGQNWDTKLNDLNKDILGSWMHPVTWADYMRSFAVPHHIPGKQILGRVSEHAGLTFDRIRLSAIAEEHAQELNAEVIEFNLKCIKLLIPHYGG